MDEKEKNMKERKDNLTVKRKMYNKTYGATLEQGSVDKVHTSKRMKLAKTKQGQQQHSNRKVPLMGAKPSGCLLYTSPSPRDS